LRGQTNWEKTAHVGAHRQQTVAAMPSATMRSTPLDDADLLAG